MSEYRVEKHRAAAELKLSTGTTVRGSFFLAQSSATHPGPERVGDLLNAEPGFFPFERQLEAGTETVLYNRAHVVAVRLLGGGTEPQLDPGYDLATERHVSVLLSNGETIAGRVRVYRPVGRDRLSDYARTPLAFRYVEGSADTFVVNSEHIVELKETAAR